MSTKEKDASLGAIPSLSAQELTAVLIKHFGITEGKFNLGVEFQIGVGAVGPKEDPLPGLIIGLKSISLAVSNLESNPTAVDAASVSGLARIAPKKPRSKATKKTPA